MPTPATRPATAGAGRVDEAPSTAPTSSPHSRGAALGPRALGLLTRTTPVGGAPAAASGGFGLGATFRTRATLAGLYGQSLVPAPANANSNSNSRYFDEDDEADLDDDGLPARQTPDSKHVCFANCRSFLMQPFTCSVHSLCLCALFLGAGAPPRIIS